MIPYQDRQLKMSKMNLSQRLKATDWVIRKITYYQLLFQLQTLTKPRLVLIDGEYFLMAKLVPLLDDLPEYRHPNVLLKGLYCVYQILTIESSLQKQFVKLVDLGLYRFPLLTQQKKTVLEKFMDVLCLMQIDANMLRSKLALPQEKVVMLVMEVIGVMGLTGFRKVLWEISRTHCKQAVKEVAAEIAHELHELVGSYGGDYQGDEDYIAQQDRSASRDRSVSRDRSSPKDCSSPKYLNAKSTQPSRVSQRPTAFPSKKKYPIPSSTTKSYLLDRLQTYEQLKPKDQQSFTSYLLTSIPSLLATRPTPTLNFSYYIRLMIEDNNHIISTNGLKLLQQLIAHNCPLLPPFFPLLFLFDKFRLHRTHPTNLMLFHVMDAALIGSRGMDLMNAIMEGLASKSAKTNIKYGSAMTFVRVVAIMFYDETLWKEYCLGEMVTVQSIYLRKSIEKLLDKGCEMLTKYKEFVDAYWRIKELLGEGDGKSKKELGFAQTVGLGRNKSNMYARNTFKYQLKNSQKEDMITTKPSNYTSSRPTSSLPAKKLSQTTTALLISPEPHLNKILELTQSPRQQLVALKKCIYQCLNSFQSCLQLNKFEMFFYCELIDTFITDYRPSESTATTISYFLIDCLKLLSKMSVPESKRGSRISMTGLYLCLRLSTCRLVLGKDLNLILNNLASSYTFETLLTILKQLFISDSNNVKKKNRRYLLKWLYQNIAYDNADQKYYELVYAIENGGNKDDEQIKESDHRKMEGENIKYGRRSVSEERGIKAKDRIDYGIALKENYNGWQEYADVYVEEQKLVTGKKLVELQKQPYIKKQVYLQRQNAVESFDDRKITSTYHNNQMMLERLRKAQFDSKTQKMYQSLYQYYRSKQKPYYNTKMAVSKQYDYPKGTKVSPPSLASFRKIQNEPQSPQTYTYDNNFNEGNISSSYTPNGIRIYGFDYFEHDISHIEGKYADCTERIDDKWDQFLVQQENAHYNMLASYCMAKDQFVLGSKRTMPKHGEGNTSPKTEAVSVEEVEVHHQELRYYDEPSHYASEEEEDSMYDNAKQGTQYKAEQQSSLTNYPYPANPKLPKKLFPPRSPRSNATTVSAPLRNIPVYIPQSQQSYLPIEPPQQSIPIQSYSAPQTSLTAKKPYLPSLPHYYLHENSYESVNYSQHYSLYYSQHYSLHYYQRYSAESPQNYSYSKSSFHYQLLPTYKLTYMLNSTSNPYPHLRGLILLPYKSHTNKSSFVQYFIHFIIATPLGKPQPFNSILLLIILLFSEIREDKSLIYPLQSLYEHMAQKCTTNYFIRTLLALLHNVIEYTEQHSRKFLLTILTKSIARMMPFAEHAIELLRDIQQFYQIGYMVYFEMFEEEYMQIKGAIEEEDCLQDIVARAKEEDSTRLEAIVEGWLMTGFKKMVTRHLREVSDAL